MNAENNTTTKKALLIIPAVMIWALLCPWTAKAGASDREIIVGDSVPVVILYDTDGNRHRIPAGEGMSVVLFWSTWSPRSAQAIDLWERFTSDYPDEPFQVVSIAAEKDELTDGDVSAISNYILKKQVSLPVIVDERLELFNSYGVKALPTVFMLADSGLVLYRYSGLPSSASLDLREELEARLGLAEPEAPDVRAAQAGSEYHPANNALLYFRMGGVFEGKGSYERASARYIEALQKDPDYEDPLRALERIYFRNGRTLEAVDSLKARLNDGGLGKLAGRVSETGFPGIQVEEEKEVPAEGEPLSPMERMQLLMEKNSEGISGSNVQR